MTYFEVVIPDSIDEYDVFLEYFDQQVKNSLNDIYSLLFTNLGEDKIMAFYVFGSVISEEYCTNNDCDLLIVLNNVATSKQINHIKGVGKTRG